MPRVTSVPPASAGGHDVTSQAVRIPADVDRPDRILAGLTARQLLVLSVTGIVLYAAWTATRGVVPLQVFLLGAIPVGVSAAILVLGHRDGISLDRLTRAAIRQYLGPRHRVAAPEGVRPAPPWLTHRATGDTLQGARPAALRLPAVGVQAAGVRTGAGTELGVVDLGGDGLAVLAVASTVNFALRTPAEQEALVASFGRYLHSLSAPVQVLVRTERLDLSTQITELRAGAGGLPHPALETAAVEHADYLAHLAQQSDLLRRQVLLILREPWQAVGASAQAQGALFRASRHAPGRDRGEVARRVAESHLARWLADAVDLLAPAGIVVTPLDSGRATAVLAAACNPDTPRPPVPGLAGADEIITTPAGPRSHPDHPGDGWGDEGDNADAEGADVWADGDTEETFARRGMNGLKLRLNRGSMMPAVERSAAGAFIPDAVSVASRHLQVGGEWVASFAVTGYPREVHPGWLAPLLTYPGRLDVSLHVEPVDPVTAATGLRRQLARLESGRRHTEEHGRLLDPHVEAATEDAYDLAARVARGEGKLFRLGLYVTVHAASQWALADEVAALRALAASLLLDAKPTTYRSLQGWVATLPMGLDLIGLRRGFDTSALAASFPFTSPDLPAPDPTSAATPGGVLYGYNVGSQGLVHWDRFALDNHNSVILGRSGAGKSYLVKLELLRSLYRGIEIAVIDPEDEYARLAAAVGATTVPLGRAGVRLNPFDVPIVVRPDGRRTAPRDALIRRSLFLHTVITVLLGAEPTATERAVLDRAITATYQHAGITADARSWTRPAPTLRDLRDTLTRAAQTGDPAAGELAARLHPFVEGAFQQLFDGASTTTPDGHLVVFSLRDLPEELKAIGTLLTLDAVWRRVSNPAIRRPRLVVVDEAWLLMKQPAGAEFLFRMAKASRKHWAGLTVSTQDTADVLSSDLGKAVVANAATQILLRQAPQAIDEITRAFDLSAGERQFLLSADRGQGLLSSGTQRVAFQAISSPTEHHLVTSDPAELADYAENRDFADSGSGQAYVDLEP
jgi:hypothetical protein